MAEHGRKHPRLLVLSTACLLALSACGGSSGGKSTQSSSPTSTASAPAAATVTATTPASSATAISAVVGGVTATMHAGTHRPKVNQPWPIHFIVSREGHPVGASVAYEYLLGSQVVAHRSHYTFTGHFSDVFMWPSSAVGYPLTFRAVIVSGTITMNLDYKVQVVA